MNNPGLIPLISSLLLLITFIWMLFVSFRRGVWWGLAIMFLSPLSTIAFAFSYWQEVKKPVVAFMLAFVFYLYTFVSLITSMFGGEIINTMSDMQDIAEQSRSGELTEKEAKEKIEAILGKLTDKLDSTVSNTGLQEEVNKDIILSNEEALPKKLERIAGRTLEGIATNTKKNAATKNIEPQTEPALHVTTKSDNQRLQELFGHKQRTDQEQLAKRNREAIAIQSKLNPTLHEQQNKNPIDYNDLNRFINRRLDIHLIDSRMQHGVLNKVTEDYIELYRIISGGRFSFEIRREKIKQVFISQR